MQVRCTFCIYVQFFTCPFIGQIWAMFLFTTSRLREGTQSRRRGFADLLGLEGNLPEPSRWKCIQKKRCSFGEKLFYKWVSLLLLAHFRKNGHLFPSNRRLFPSNGCLFMSKPRKWVFSYEVTTHFDQMACNKSIILPCPCWLWERSTCAWALTLPWQTSTCSHNHCSINTIPHVFKPLW